MKRATITAIAGILCFSSISSARQVEDWPYERLLKEADVVVVARAVSTVRSKDKWEAAVFEANRFVAFETTFESAAVLKGELADTFKVLHFQYRSGSTLFNDGPGLVTFLTKPLSLETGKAVRPGKGESKKLRPVKSMSLTSAPEYLLFLKKRPDGRFEAVSGQVDPEFSVRTLFRTGL